MTDARHLRILFILRAYAPDAAGGAARSVQELAEGLQRRGHDIHIARLTPKGRREEYIAKAREAGLLDAGRPTLHFVELRNIFWPFEWKKRGRLKRLLWHVFDMHNLGAKRDIKRLVAAVKPDVVNTSVITGFSTSIFSAVKESGAKLVHTFRDYYLACPKSDMYKAGANCPRVCGSCQPFQKIRAIDAKNVDLFLSNSDFVSKRHRTIGSVGPDKPCLTQLNINRLPSGDWLRERPKKAMVFGFIGRCSEEKGVEVLLEAARRLPSDAPAWELHMAGDGEASYVERLRDEYGADPRIKFLGWMNSDAFYKGVDFLVCPSTYEEPLPRVIYEGYGYGLPTLGTRTGGIPEILDEGVQGHLYDAHDVDRLRDLMLQALVMPTADYQALSRNALAKAQDFTGESVMEVYLRRMTALVDGAKLDDEFVAAESRRLASAVR